MSTIDLTKVAGIQAVDNEGKVIGTLSVNDLTELVASNLVESTRNQIAPARSASLMSEASTLAATDEYEDQLPQDANPAFVRTLDSSGNPKQTAIASLASVVGELIGEANYAKTGMMGKNYCMRKLVDNGGTGKYYMFKIPGFRAYASYEILATTDDGRMLWCVFTFSPYNGNPIKPALIKNKEFYGAIKFFRKEGDNNSNYFQLYTGSNATSLFIRCVTANFDVNAVESSNESAESLIEIPMS
ncbi:hypothetical protein [Bacteroides mediterraneensis]|uniref:hypothetical protein n=1 Tax=Bacteroides mediterraneensis TaxID=1841856 RepID=UPI0026F16A77|nr:hypothetical protein [Bacteroides mediterraneensis]